MNCEKRTIEICGSFSGKITTNIQYENRDAFFSVKEVLEGCDITDEEIKMRQKMLNDLCYQNYNEKIDEIKGIVRTPAAVPEIVELPEALVHKKCEFFAMISQAKDTTELRGIGELIAKIKNKFPKNDLQELKDEFNTKMYELKGFPYAN